MLIIKQTVSLFKLVKICKFEKGISFPNSTYNKKNKRKGRKKEMKRFLFGLVRFVVLLAAVPTALVVGVLKGSPAALEILDWPDGVCCWLKRQLTAEKAFFVLLMLAGIAMAGLGTNFVWSARHVDSPLLDTLGSRAGLVIAGIFTYLAGLALILIAIRVPRPPREKPPVFMKIW